MRPLDQVLRVLGMTCEEVAFLASEAMDRPLSFSEGLGAKLHRWICPGCRHYRDQLLILQEVLRHLDERGAAGCPAIPQETRERILQVLRNLADA